MKTSLGTLDGTSTIADFLGDSALFKEIPSGSGGGDTVGGTY